MNLTDFFGLVLPTSGYIILAEPLESKGYKHHVFSDVDAAVTKAVDLNFNHKNVFFALAGFRAEKVWNPSIKNPDGSAGRWQVRTQANAGWLNSLFLDLDIDPAASTPEKQAKVYATREAALDAIDALVAKVGLPAPMILDSGGGWHVYWPFTDEVTRDEWQPMADKFKAICLSEGMHIDPAVPADAARVLRPLGCHNLKRPNAREVSLFDAGDGPSPAQALQLLLDTYEQANGLSLPKRPAKMPAGLAGSAPSNVGRSTDPVDFGHVSFACGVIGGQVAIGGKGTTEPLWRAVLGIAKLASDPMAAMLSVSDQHADFSKDVMLAKAAGWNASATRCEYFKKSLQCPECQTCPHTISSPAQLGRMKEEAPAPVEKVVNVETGVVEEIEIIKPPPPYIRHFDAHHNQKVVSIASEDADGNPEYKLVAPGDFYPVRILRNTAAGEISERTLWRFDLPRLAPFTTEIKQSVLGDSKGLQALLNNLGVYAHSDQIKAIQRYMSAYLNHLSKERDRERVYTRLGWQFDSNDEAPSRVGFTIGNRQVNMDGTVTPCNVSQGVKNAVKNGIHTKGNLSEWTRWMNQHYADDIYRAHRFFIYCSLAAPLYHMTTYKGVLVTASGKSGRGKTTALMAGSSIWGHPEALILNGNPQGATDNATENHLGTLHSLPMMWDDTTERISGEMLKFALHIPQGNGKQRMKGSEHDGRSVTWETIVLSSTNYDTMMQALSNQVSTDAHLMRMISVPFEQFHNTTAAMNEADQFKRAILNNYGHAGGVFMQYVTANYAAVAARIEAAAEQAATDFTALPHERFWFATVAVAKVAGEIANQLGLLDFPVQEDYKWMGAHVGEMRAMHSEFKVDCVEELAAYLEAHLSETLVMSSKATSNLDNVAHMPQRELNIRHEMDHGVIYIAKAALGRYCAEKNESIRAWEEQLVAAGVLLDRAKQKTLGADTKHAKGQVRCWVIDATKLGTQFATTVQRAINNVVSLPATGT